MPEGGISDVENRRQNGLHPGLLTGAGVSPSGARLDMADVVRLLTGDVDLDRLCTQETMEPERRH